MPDTGHVFAVVVTQQRKHPRDYLREAVLWYGVCHDADCLALVGHWHARAAVCFAVSAAAIITLVFTAILDSDILNPKYPAEVWMGVAIGLLAIYFIGRSM